MIITNREQVKSLIIGVKENIKNTHQRVKVILEENNSIDALACLKFDKTSFDPLSGEIINFIEMLNQSYSNLVVLNAVDDLLQKYPTRKFELHMGARSGFDISTLEEDIVAECFATVTAFNNQKINKDSDKLMQLDEHVKKYIYFYSHDDSEDKISTFISKYPNIKFVRIRNFN